MSRLFDDLKHGLEQAIEYEKGKGHASVTKLRFLPVESFASGEIRTIRMASGMSQSAFASFLGVSKKTVEAWECGRNDPSGPARRLLSLLRDDRSIAERFISSSK